MLSTTPLLTIVARWSVVAAIAACTTPAPRRAVPSNMPPPTTPTPVATAAPAADAPPEPWFHDKDDAYADCVAPSAAPRVALPAPYQRCDGAEVAWASPPTGNELHFHYRAFSAATTDARRADTPDVCCYLVWAFPR